MVERPAPQRPQCVAVAPESSGSLWPLRQIVGAGGEFRIRDWVVHARPGQNFIEVIAPAPSKAWIEHSAIVEQALDLLSVAGGQHYEREAFTPRNQRIKWDWIDGKFVVDVHTIWKEELPLTMFVGPASEVKEEEAPRTPRYSKAMRYFRASQSASTIAAAYQNLFLCLEALVSAAVPKGQEREEDWLKRALGQLIPAYEERARNEIEAEGGLEADLRTIYDIRLALFHAKLDRDPLIPGDAAGFAKVEHAFWRLIDHVRELFRPYGVWPSATRLGTVREINETGEFLLPLTNAGILQEGEPLSAQFQGITELKAPEWRFVVRWVFPDGWSDQVWGFSWTFGPAQPKHWLTFMPVTTSPTVVNVHVAVGGGFRHLIRCPEV